MAVVKALELVAALLALVTLPCAVAAMICADELIAGVRRSVARRRERWMEQRLLHQMERSFVPPRPFLAPVTSLFTPVTTPLSVGAHGSGAGDRPDAMPGWLALPANVWASLTTRRHDAPSPPAEFVPESPPFERIVAELHRLSGERRNLGRHDKAWGAAVTGAYDGQLRHACRALEIGEHLDELDGVDRDIERVRVEGLLIAAGVRLR